MNFDQLLKSQQKGTQFCKAIILQLKKKQLLKCKIFLLE